MENTTVKNDLVLDVHESPKKKSQWVLLSLQHILAMFVACITVPLIIGTSIPATIISAGVGTLIYILFTQKKSPVVLASSFAYLSSMGVAFALDAIQDPVSLFEPIYHDDGDAIYVMDQLKDEHTNDEDWLTHVAIESGMEKLSEREQNIIRLRFFQGRTQMEVADEIGISQAQVSRLEKSALRHMRKYV